MLYLGIYIHSDSLTLLNMVSSSQLILSVNEWAEELEHIWIDYQMTEAICLSDT